MRGFRGSRAAQNDMAHRHGRHDQPHFQQGNGRWPSAQGDANQQRPALPEWLKTAETRAREAEISRNPVPALPAPVRPILKAVPAPAAHVASPATPARPVQPRPELKLVKNTAPVAVAKPVAPVAKKAAPAKRKAAAAPKKAAASKAPAKRAPAKRKAA